MAQSVTDLLGPGGPEQPEREPAILARSPRELFWSRFKEDKLAMLGGALVVFMILVALSAPIFERIVGHPPDEQYRREMLNEFGGPNGPNGEFWFGGDDLGRDLFVRVLYGAQTSLRIAVLATGVELVIGITLGLLAGFFRGWVDTVVSRVIDLILAIPFFLLAISLFFTIGGGERAVIFIIALFGWPYIARIVRGQTLSLRESQFVEAAYSVGAGSTWIMFREILPNLVAPIIVYATLIIPQNILAEAGLTFLGVGIQEPTPAWGGMLADATGLVIFGAGWWYMTYPGIALLLTVLGFNLLGDGLRDALDPKTRR